MSAVRELIVAVLPGEKTGLGMPTEDKFNIICSTIGKNLSTLSERAEATLEHDAEEREKEISERIASINEWLAWEGNVARGQIESKLTARGIDMYERDMLVKLHENISILDRDVYGVNDPTSRDVFGWEKRLKQIRRELSRRGFSIVV